MGRRLKVRGSLVLVAAVLPLVVTLAVVPANANADVGRGSVSSIAEEVSSSWITYGEATAGASVFTVEGERLAADECGMEFSGTMKAGQEGVQVDELAFNPATCESVVATSVVGEKDGQTEKGAVVDSVVSVPVPDEGGLVSSVNGPAPEGQVAAKAGWTNSQATLKAYYEDPVQLDVNSTRVRVNWSWNNVNCVRAKWGRVFHGWYQQSGWKRKDHNSNNAYGCNDHRVDTYAHFKNDKFCFTIDTHAYYDRTKIQGMWNGDAVWSASMRKKGGCTSFLSRHVTVKREKN